MPDQMVLIVTLRKDVADTAEANTLAEIVKTKLEDHPDVSITAQTANHIDLTD